MAFSSSFCSFSDRGRCGDSRGKSEVVNLRSCVRDISDHLSSCHLPRNLREYEVILARSGHFDSYDSYLESWSICPNHRDSLGRYWRGPTSCQYPTHRGKRKQVKDRHVINMRMAAEIMDMHNVVVAAGSRKSLKITLCFKRLPNTYIRIMLVAICTTCRMAHSAKLEEDRTDTAVIEDPRFVHVQNIFIYVFICYKF